jgi:succinate dehydrogenase/fumarate reductase flavoprotein subunit
LRPIVDAIETDVLILGAAGAGLCAALHAADRSPSLSVAVVVKGLLGRAGCTRMVQGGYNAVLTEPDSLDAHFLDTLAGGGWINDQELVWTLVVQAPGRVLELESRYGCLFDRTPEGRIHQKPFAGQTHDRTIHKGDLTGIEIMNRLSEQVPRRPKHPGTRAVATAERIADELSRRGVQPGVAGLDQRDQPGRRRAPDRHQRAGPDEEPGRALPERTTGTSSPRRRRRRCAPCASSRAAARPRCGPNRSR